jgi:hypothetical protein
LEQLSLSVLQRELLDEYKRESERGAGER